jgi:hypothetical protein
MDDEAYAYSPTWQRARTVPMTKRALRWWSRTRDVTRAA